MQQSRFLALVSNEDLLKQSLATAKDSEGAGTVQALKTMESLETKIQQVQTAYQQFYTTMGIESVWKSSLDWIRNIIDNLNDMPKAFGKIPVAAIGAIGSLVSLLKNILTKGLEKVAVSFVNFMNRLPKEGASEAKAAATTSGEQIANSVAEGINKGRLKVTQAYLAMMAEASGKTVVTDRSKAANLNRASFMFNNLPTGNGTTQDAWKSKIQSLLVDNGFAAQDDFNNIKSLEQWKQKIQEILNKYYILKGVIPTVSQESVNGPTQATKELTKYDILLQKLQGSLAKIKASLKQAFTTPEGLKQIGTMVSSLGLMIDQSTTGGRVVSGALQALGGLGTSAMQVLTGDYSQAIFTFATTVVSGISTIVETPTEKIQRLTEETEKLNNEAVLAKDSYKNLDTAIEKYEELKEKRYDSEEAAAEYQEQVDSLAESYPELISGFEATGEAIIDVSKKEQMLAEYRRDSAEATLEAAIRERELKEEEYKNSNNDLAFSFDRSYDAGTLANSILALDFKNDWETDNTEIYSPFFEAALDENGNISIGDESIDYSKLTGLINTIASSFDGEAVYAAILDLQELLGPDKSQGVLDLLGINIQDEEIMSLINETNKKKQELRATDKKLISAKLALDNAEKEFVEEGSALFTVVSNEIADAFTDSGLTYKKFIKSDEYTETTLIDAAESFWQGLTEDNKELFNEMYNSDNVSFENLVETFNIEKDSDLYNALANQYSSAIENWKELITNRLASNGRGTSLSVNTKTKYDAYSKAIDQYEKLLDKGYTSLASSYLLGFENLYQSIQDSNELSAAEKDAVFSKINEADLTSYGGIFNLSQELTEYYEEIGKELPDDLSGYLDLMRVSIVSNLTLGFSALADSLVQKIEEIDKALGKATEALDISEAVSLYEKIKEFAIDSEGNQLGFTDVFSASAEDPSKYIITNAKLLQEYREKQIADAKEEAEKLREKIGKANINDVLSLNLDANEYDTWEKVVSTNEEVLKPFEELGLQDEVLAVLNNEDGAGEKLKTALAEAGKEAEQASKLVNELETELQKSSPIQDALALGKYAEARSKAEDAYGENSVWVSKVDRDAENAYSEMLDNYLSSTKEQFSKDAYKYTGDLKETFDEISGKEKSVEAVKDLAEHAGYTKEQLNEALSQLYEETFTSAGQPAIQKAFESVLKDPSAIELDALESLANSLGNDLDIILAYFTNNNDGTYSASYEEIISLMGTFGVEATSAIQDALAEYLDSIVDIFGNGLDGKMSQTEFDSLNTFFGGSLNLDFTQTAEGLKLTKQAAIEVYTELKKIDSIKAQLAFDDLAESLEEVGSGYETVADTMRTIAKLNQELAKVPVDSSRRKELEKELSVAEEILRVRSSDPDSFSFMDNDLPDGMKGPENYWNSIGDAYKAMNEATSSGYMEIQDFYNIVNQMDAMMTAAGEEFEFGGMNAAQLIEAGLGALSDIDGEGVKISLEKLGIDFLGGAEGMKAKFGDSMKVMAKSQIEMLDAAIRMLEAMVALEDLDANGDGILSGAEIFEGEDGKTLNTKAKEWLKQSLGAAADITIGGKTLIDAIETLSPEKIEEFFAELSKIDYTDPMKVAEQLQQILKIFFPSENISMKESVFDILKIPTGAGEDSETFNAWLEDMGLSIDEYQSLKKMLTDDTGLNDIPMPLYESIKKMLGIDENNSGKFDEIFNDLRNQGMRLSEILSLWNDITITDEGNFIYDGTTYGSIGEVIAARNLKLEKGASVSKVEGGTIEGEINYSGITFKVNISNGETTYTATWDGKTYSGTSEDDVLNQIWQARQFDLKKQYTSKEDFKTSVTGTIEPEIEVKPILQKSDLGSEDGITEEVIEEYGLDTTLINNITAAVATADWGPVGEAVGEGIKKAFNPAEGENSLDIGDLTIKPSSITIDATGITPTIEGINMGENGTGVLSYDGAIEISPASTSISVNSDNVVLPEDTVEQIFTYFAALASLNAVSNVSVNASAETSGMEDADTEKVNNFSAAVGNIPESVSSDVSATAGIPSSVLFKILKLVNAVKELESNPTISTAFSASIKEESQQAISDLLEAYGYNGETAQVFFSISDTDGTIDSLLTQVNNLLEEKELPVLVTVDDTEVQNAINELTGEDKKVNFKFTYDEPDAVGPSLNGEEGVFSLTGVSNANGNRVNIGQYNSITEALIAALDKTGTGEYQEGSLEIEKTDMTLGDGTTMSANAVELIAGVIEGAGSTDNNNNNNDNGGGGTINTTPTDSTTTTASFDNSSLLSDLAGLESASSAAAGSVSIANDAISGLDVSSINAAAGRITWLASAASKIPSSGAGKIQRLSTAINNLQSKTITAKVNVTVSVSESAGAKGTVSISNGNITSNSSSGSVSLQTDMSKVKGNVALAKGNRTLMGELGPELVVSNGRYFTVGNNGAEFVDLDDDAIVFNHLQTKRLLSSGSSGRGTPITNEHNATAFATGNAMASAQAALDQLISIRAMWQALLDASSKELGSKAGSGGGGGGGGGGNNQEAGYEYDLERWYNMLRQIAKLEQQITYEQAKRENMRSGYKYADSLEKELDLLKEQLRVEKKLASLQYDYYKKRMTDVNSSAYSKIFTYDEQGLMQYVDGENMGLDALAKLQATDENGVLKMTAKQQYQYIVNTLGVSASDLKYKSDGSVAENYTDKVQVFFDQVDGLMNELDELYDSYHEHAEKIEDLTSSQNEILQEYIDNQLSLEGKLLQAIEDREQAEIDRLQDEKDALEKATQDYIEGLNDALSKEQDLYNKNQTDEETAKLQRRLAILQRSGGSASEIKSLQDQLDSRLQDAYFQAQQDQIDAIQEASDKQLEKLQTQIELMTEALEYQKENGLLWNEVYEMMNDWTPEKILQFIEQYTKSYKENSALQDRQDSEETLKEAEIYKNKQKTEKFDSFEAKSSYSDEVKESARQKAKEAFFTEMENSGNIGNAENAATAIYAKTNAIENYKKEFGGYFTEGQYEKLGDIYLNGYKISQEKANQDSVDYLQSQLSKDIKFPYDGGKLSKNTYLYKDNNQMRDGNDKVIGSYTSYKKENAGKIQINDITTDSEGRKVYAAKIKGKSGYIYASNVENGEALYQKFQIYKKLEGMKENIPSFSSGGDIDFTGVAMVHGSKKHPENILNAEHTKLLKEGIFSNSNHSLIATVEAVQDFVKNIVSASQVSNTGITIENAIVNIQPGVISNDYEARRAGEMALEEMVKIARKTTNRTIRR